MFFTTRGRKQTALLIIAAMCWMTVGPTVVAARTIEVPAGTAINCTFPTPIDPLTATVGQRITLRVVEALKIDGVTVVEAGAPVVAEITQAQKKGSVGKPAIIGVTLYSATAIDGSSIPLSGQRVIEGENKQTSSLVITILCCVLGLLQKGGDATIPEGAQVTATTTGTVKVDV